MDIHVPGPPCGSKERKRSTCSRPTQAKSTGSPHSHFFSNLVDVVGDRRSHIPDRKDRHYMLETICRPLVRVGAGGNQGCHNGLVRCWRCEAKGRVAAAVLG